MAITYTYNDAWQSGQAQWRKGIEQTAFEYATNNAISKMWLSYDWRGTVQNFDPFWLVPNCQDYGRPFYSVPTDFYGLREVYLVQVASNSVPVRYPMRVVENLQETHVQALPNVICYRAAIQGFRVFPMSPMGGSSPLYMIDGTYKTRPPKITRAQQSSLILWDDVYFEIFVQALAWAVLVASGDRKAAIEQDQIFMQSLMQATASENIELGEPTIAPGEGLVSGGYGSWGIGGPW